MHKIQFDHTDMGGGIPGPTPIENPTFGQKAVGINFNPSLDDKVGQAKQGFADVIDQANDLRNTTESSEVKRLCSVAITEAQSAQMFWLRPSLGKTNWLQY